MTITAMNLPPQLVRPFLVDLDAGPSETGGAQSPFVSSGAFAKLQTPPPPVIELVDTPPPAQTFPVPRVAPLSQEEKQERQRMHVRRSYYKKRNFIRSLRDQVAELEERYAKLLASRPGGNRSNYIDSSAPAAVEDISGLSPTVDTMASAEAVQVFMKLSVLRDSLRHENDELKKTLIRYANYVRRVQQCVEDAQQEAEEHPMPHVDTIDFHISPAECAAINVQAYEEIQRFMHSEEFTTTGVSVFGWHDKRRVVEGYVQFCVQKFYQERSALELSLATWELLSSPSRFLALYSSTLSIDLRLVDRVDEDNIIYYRRIEKAGGATTTKSIFQVSRFRTDLGYVILLRTCDHKHQKQHLHNLKQLCNVNEEWHDVFSWILLEEHGDAHQHAQYSFGGRVDTSAGTPQFWMLEVLLLSLRWESTVIGPTFCLGG